MSDKPIEAEVVEQSQALAIRPQTGLPTVQDLEQQFALAVRQRELLSEYIKKQLKAGKHFYQRGSQKPSLAKEGAEIILLPHNLAPDYEQTGGPDSPPPDDRPYQITVKCVLRRKGDPQSFVGSGIGSAGSHKGTWGGPNKKNWLYEPRQTDKYLCHNATLKMAQKSAMIAATINSTAASEFFTQDMDPDAEPMPKGTPKPPQPSRPPSTTTPPIKTPPAPPKAQQQRFPTDKTRAWMIKELKAGQGQECRAIVTEYFSKVRIGATSGLMPDETIEHLPLRFVPVSKRQLEALAKKIGDFEAGGDAEPAFPPNAEEPPAERKSAIPRPKSSGGVPPTTQTTTTPPTRTTSVLKSPAEHSATTDDEWWRDIIVPVPRKGMKRDAYLKHPDTIGSLFDMRHGADDESQAARQRLWGFVHNYEPKGWTKNDGTQMPPSEGDLKFREALDAFADWYERNHPGEPL